MKTIFGLFLILVLAACSAKSKCNDCETCGENLNVKEESMEDALMKAQTGPAQVDTTELQESIAKIEEKYGEQWDFCDCVIKGDSINKAFSKPNLPDAEFNRLAARFDVIDEKCQAFRIQDANRTPEQREAHEKKVRKCLRDAGIKN
jgi:hypothetical protein